VKILLTDNQIVVCVKPTGVLSTDEPNGVPDLVREVLGDQTANVRTVHRLDRTVGGVMLLARTRHAASDLGRQVMERLFEKEYLAVVHGTPTEPLGTFSDLLWREKAERKTYVADVPGEGVREAVLQYRVLGTTQDLSLVRIRLGTGRTHQIRVQFSSRGLPLVGDRKYGVPETEESGIALWSYRLAFEHPKTGERIEISERPPRSWPWTEFTLED